jgi:ABC-type sulfate/molybdate transport systems ATPase subunit
LSGDRRRSRIEALLAETLFPPSAWHRRPAELSGGESQRLALARALATEPEILLMDEPLAQMDASLRTDLLELIGRVVRGRGITTLYVTHQCQEAMELCDRIGVMLAGRLVVEGTPDHVFWNPPDRTTAMLTGPMVELPRRLLEEGRVARSPAEGKIGVVENGDMLAVRPQQLQWIMPQGRNAWQVAACRPDGAGWLIVLASETWRLPVVSTVALATGASVGIELTRAQPDSMYSQGKPDYTGVSESRQNTP